MSILSEEFHFHVRSFWKEKWISWLTCNTCSNTIVDTSDDKIRRCSPVVIAEFHVLSNSRDHWNLMECNNVSAWQMKWWTNCRRSFRSLINRQRVSSSFQTFDFIFSSIQSNWEKRKKREICRFHRYTENRFVVVFHSFIHSLIHTHAQHKWNFLNKLIDKVERQKREQNELEQISIS